MTTQKIARYRFASFHKSSLKPESAYEALRLPIVLRTREALRSLHKEASETEMNTQDLHAGEAEILQKESDDLQHARQTLSQVVQSIFNDISTLLNKIPDVHQKERKMVGSDLSCFEIQLLRAPVVAELASSNFSESTFVWSQFLSETRSHVTR